jgi:hypothetical protein
MPEMRYIIGIIVGIVIVLNWGKVSTLFDTSVAQQQPTAAAVAAVPPPPPPPSAPDEIVANHMAKAAADQ